MILLKVLLRPPHPWGYCPFQLPHLFKFPQHASLQEASDSVLLTQLYSSFLQGRWSPSQSSASTCTADPRTAICDGKRGAGSRASAHFIQTSVRVRRGILTPVCMLAHVCVLMCVSKGQMLATVQWFQISNRNLGGHESERAGGNKAGLLQKYTRQTENASVEGIFQSFVFLSKIKLPLYFPEYFRLGENLSI